MLKRVLLIGGIVAALILAVVGYTVFRTPEAASGPIQAIPIAPTGAASGAAPTVASDAAPTSAASGAAPTAASDAAPTGGAAAAAPQIFEIVPTESEARFLIDEVLRGSPVTVVGTTNQVAGQIAIDPSNPASAQVGTIQVNARTIVTDNDFRNRAIKNAILQTDQYEFVTFKPTSISGLPASVAANTPFTFQMIGDLTVRDVTKPVTFDVTVTPISATELKGSAKTSLLYRDLGLNIPDSPSVDTVADEVRLELDFIARPSAG
ncbi:MAG: YceI family protein [Roseiflexaceae bacterium]